MSIFWNRLVTSTWYFQVLSSRRFCWKYSWVLHGFLVPLIYTWPIVSMAIIRIIANYNARNKILVNLYVLLQLICLIKLCNQLAEGKIKDDPTVNYHPFIRYLYQEANLSKRNLFSLVKTLWLENTWLSSWHQFKCDEGQQGTYGTLLSYVNETLDN